MPHRWRRQWQTYTLSIVSSSFNFERITKGIKKTITEKRCGKSYRVSLRHTASSTVCPLSLSTTVLPHGSPQRAAPSRLTRLAASFSAYSRAGSTRSDIYSHAEDFILTSSPSSSSHVHKQNHTRQDERHGLGSLPWGKPMFPLLTDHSRDPVTKDKPKLASGATKTLQVYLYA